MSEDYIKQLEAENELLRRRIEMNPTLADILKRYFLLCKTTNRDGYTSYGLTLTPMASSNFLHEDDYKYLKGVGIYEEEVFTERDDMLFEKGVTVTNDSVMVNELLDEHYKSIKDQVPQNFIDGLSESCQVNSIEEYTKHLKKMGL